MKNNNSIIELAKQTVEIERDAISNLIKHIDESFEQAIQAIHHCKGRVIITGIGKSAIIGNKIVATLNSTGTPAVFMHAADAIHGDLGNILIDDIVICISNSGNTPEIKVLAPFIKSYGNQIVAITGNPESFLAQEADFVLNSNVEKEACPNNLAPTSSTTAQLVIGDAIAVCLLDLNKFGSQDFAKYHPGGALGKKLFLRVDDLVKDQDKPEVSEETLVKDVIIEISKKRLGATIVSKDGAIQGVITDGDIRRILQETGSIDNLIAKDVMSNSPITIPYGTMAVDTLKVMKENDISQIVVEDDGKYMGIVHLHDLIKEGIY